MTDKKKFKTCVFHMGADKTGSTSIQTFFDHHRDTLLQKGIVAYPPGAWHAQLGSCFSDQPLSYVWNIEQGRNVKEQVVKSDQTYLKKLTDWLEVVPVCDHLILSYEGFIDLAPSTLVRVREFLAGYAESVVAVIYVRPPLSYAISAMSQRVKMGGKAWSDEKPPIFAYHHFLEVILQAFTKDHMQVRVFEREQLYMNDVVQDFIAKGLTRVDELLSLHTPEALKNESLTDAGIRVGERLIEYLDDLKVDFPSAIFNHRFGERLARIPGSRQRLTHHQIAVLMRAFTNVNAYLFSRYNLQFKEDPAGFLADATTYSSQQAALEDLHFFYLSEALVDSLRVCCATGSITMDTDRVASAPGEEISLTVQVRNQSCCDWISTQQFPINLSYHIHRSDGRLYAFDGIRTPLMPPLIVRNTEVSMSISLKAPLETGVFRVDLSMVQEGVAWFENNGFTMHHFEWSVQ